MQHAYSIAQGAAPSRPLRLRRLTHKVKRLQKNVDGCLIRALHFKQKCGVGKQIEPEIISGWGITILNKLKCLALKRKRLCVTCFVGGVSSPQYRLIESKTV